MAVESIDERVEIDSLRPIVRETVKCFLELLVLNRPADNGAVSWGHFTIRSVFTGNIYEEMLKFVRKGIKNENLREDDISRLGELIVYPMCILIESSYVKGATNGAVYHWITDECRDPSEKTKLARRVVRRVTHC